MGIRSTMCWLGVTAVLSSVFAADEPKKPATESMGWKHMATVSQFRAAPVLDGKLEPGEWDRAVSTINFMSLAFCSGKEEPSASAMFMDLREGKTWCGFYSNRLYIAMVSALPPRTLPSGQHSYPQPRDAELVFDPNAVEIWLDPNRDRRESLRRASPGFLPAFRQHPGLALRRAAGAGQGCGQGLQHGYPVRPRH